MPISVYNLLQPVNQARMFAVWVQYNNTIHVYFMIYIIKLYNITLPTVTVDLGAFKVIIVVSAKITS
jgi:hypothetical protein